MTKAEIWIVGSCLAIGSAAGLYVLLNRHKGRRRPKVDLSVFDSPDQPGSGKCMDPAFIRMLQDLERETGYPVFDHINSGARSPKHNSKVGGVSNSSHKIPTCRAADIHAPSLSLRKQLVFAAKKVGFRRIGIGQRFVHLDNDPKKKQDVAWGYPKGRGAPFRVF